MNLFKRIPKWIVGPFLLMSLTYLLWFYVVLPLEHRFISGSSIFASFLYLPHFVRVLATWFFGYRAFFGLVAGHSLGFLITTGSPPSELAELAIIIVGSGSAVAALWLLDWAKLLQPAEITKNEVNWRAMVFLGFFASLFNAIGAAMIRLDGAPAEEMLPFILRILVGDTGSVFLGLIVMMFAFRSMRSKLAD